MAPTTMRPAEVFALRLRETRGDRGLSQAELAQRITESGRGPLTPSALSRIESGERGISLDEAIGLAMELNASPAHLLTPPADAMLSVNDRWAMDGAALREWLRYGLWNWDTGEEPTGDVGHEEGLKADSDRRIVRLAEALLDAARIRDKEAQAYAIRAIQAEFHTGETETTNA